MVAGWVVVRAMAVRAWVRVQAAVVAAGMAVVAETAAEEAPGAGRLASGVRELCAAFGASSLVSLTLRDCALPEAAVALELVYVLLVQILTAYLVLSSLMELILLSL